MIIDFNRLKTFCAVAHLGSITLTAAKLHITQQAVSSQISLLEQDLGILLFKRANRKIYLTKEGQRIFSKVSQNFTAIENEIFTLADHLNTLDGTITIGASNEVAEVMLAPLIVEFNKQFPKLNFEFVLGADILSETGVLEGQLDLAFVVFSNDLKLLKVQPFRQEDFITVASKSFIKRHNLNIKRIDELLHLPLIDFASDCPALKTWIGKNDKKMLSHFANKTAIVAANDERMIKRLVLSHMGIANAPKFLFEQALEDGEVIEILPKLKKTTAGIDIISMKKKTESLAVKSFIDFALNQ